MSGAPTVVEGDCLDILPTLDADSMDACVTDPPYHLTSIVKRFGSDTAAPAKSNGATGVYSRASAGFRGKTWDGGDIAMRPETWAEVLRVLKPGAHLLAFGGTRTFHRMAVAIEDAGFEIRDCVMWVYGSGFPKSHDVSKAIDKAAGVPIEANPVTDAARQWQGWGTALKPAWEPIIVARKPLVGTVAANVLATGTGAINIDACRVTGNDNPVAWNTPRGGIWSTDPNATGTLVENTKGRFPANVIHDGSDEVMACFPDAPGQQRFVGPEHGAKTSVNTYGDYGPRETFMPRGDRGTAARFFYCAKAAKKDRAGSKHPTVKPIALIRYLCRLVTPPGGTVLDPFAGSGTTGQAALEEGFRALLIEREAEYVADILRRLEVPEVRP